MSARYPYLHPVARASGVQMLRSNALCGWWREAEAFHEALARSVLTFNERSIHRALWTANQEQGNWDKMPSGPTCPSIVGIHFSTASPAILPRVLVVAHGGVREVKVGVWFMSFILSGGSGVPIISLSGPGLVGNASNPPRMLNAMWQLCTPGQGAWDQPGRDVVCVPAVIDPEMPCIRRNEI